MSGTDRDLGQTGRKFWAKVVSVDDPHQQGRLQIRVFGLHDDTTMIPDSELPWGYPVIPISHGASLGGRGQAPVGVVPGTVVTGHIVDGDSTIFQIEGSLVSAGTTKQGQIIDGSFAIDPTKNDVPHSARGQDLNAAIGLKNLLAIASGGAAFRNLTSGIGYLPTVVPIISTLMRLDPNNTSGSFAGAVISLGSLALSTTVATRTGATGVASSAILRGLATAIGVYGLAQTLTVVNSMDRSSLSSEALAATNAALSVLAVTAQHGGTQAVISQSLPALYVTASSYGIAHPGMNRGPLGQTAVLSNAVIVGQAAQGYRNEDLIKTAQFLNVLTGITDITQMSNLGGIQGIMAIVGGSVFATSLLSDLVANALISSMQSSFTPDNLSQSLNASVDQSHLGGMNMVLGQPVRSQDSFGSIAATILDPITSSSISIVQTALSTLDTPIDSITSTINEATSRLAVVNNHQVLSAEASDPVAPASPAPTDATSSFASTNGSTAVKFVSEVGTASIDTFKEVQEDVQAEVASEAAKIDLTPSDVEQEQLITDELIRRKRVFENVG